MQFTIRVGRESTAADRIDRALINLLTAAHEARFQQLASSSPRPSYDLRNMRSWFLST